MRRHLRSVSLVFGALLLIAGIIVGGFKLFVRYLRSQVEVVISSAEVLSGTPSAAVPFRYAKGWIIVHASLNDDDHECTFIVDTGAEATCVLKSTAARLGLRPVTIAGVPIGGDEQSVVLLDRLHVGGVTYGEVGAVVVDDQAMEPISCLVDGGIIGINVLSRADLRIDFAHGVLTIGEPSTEDEKELRLPFARDGNRGLALLELSLSAVDTIPLLLDTGFSGSVLLSLSAPQLVRAACAPNDVRHYRTGPQLGSVHMQHGVIREGWTVRLDSCSLGPLGLRNLPMAVQSSTGDEDRGLLGNDVLDRYQVTIRWAKNLLCLAPLAGRDLPTNLEVTGLTTLPHRSRLIVHTVYQGSEADALGIAPNDEIIAMNGCDISSLTREDLCRLWLDESAVESAAAESMVVVIRHEGEEITGVLGRFQVLPPVASPPS